MREGLIEVPDGDRGIEWEGDGRFVRALGHGCDLRVGLLFDRLSFGWLVYDARTMERIGWGERSTMIAAQAQAEAIAEALGPGDAVPRRRVA